MEGGKISEIDKRGEWIFVLRRNFSKLVSVGSTFIREMRVDSIYVLALWRSLIILVCRSDDDMF